MLNTQIDQLGGFIGRHMFDPYPFDIGSSGLLCLAEIHFEYLKAGSQRVFERRDGLFDQA